MSKKRSRAAPRGQRSHPQEERICSLNFLPQMQEIGGAFVPHADFLALQKKYRALFNRTQRERRRLRLALYEKKFLLSQIYGKIIQ